MVIRAAMLAVFVGTILLLINHGDHLEQEPICPNFCLKASLTYVVPFFVSLISSVWATNRSDKNH